MGNAQDSGNNFHGPEKTAIERLRSRTEYYGSISLEFTLCDAMLE